MAVFFDPFRKIELGILPGVYRMPAREVATVLRGLTCLHRRMKSCCTPCCGHLHCPDCGLTWDTHAEC